MAHVSASLHSFILAENRRDDYTTDEILQKNKMIGSATLRIDSVANIAAEKLAWQENQLFTAGFLWQTEALSTFSFLFDTVYPSPKFNRQKLVTFCIAASLVVFISLFDE